MNKPEDLILDLLKQNYLKNDNTCGVSIARLLNDLKLSYAEAKPILYDFLKAKKIFARKGINGILLFLNV